MGAQWKQKGREISGAKRGALISRIAKEIIMAAKGGDPSPESNARLRVALENARKNSVPRDTIERALKKGRGETDENITYETVTYEGFCPHQVPIMVECLTDNRNRTASDVRMLFRKGQLGGSGAVAWMFDRRGVVEATHPSGMDPEDAAIEAGAQEVRPGEEGATEFVCDVGDVEAVSKALSGLGWVVSSAELGWVPKNPLTLEEAAEAEVATFVGGFEDNDDVHRIYVGLA
jgi:YebC/PmpR family DNA-binding regulatory protein